MKTQRHSMLGFILTFLLFAVAGCSPGTQLETTWKAPSAEPINFKKVAVVVVNSTPGERRSQEDELVRHITKAAAIPSYTFVSDDDLLNVATVKEKIIQNGFDGAIVLRLVNAAKQATYVPGKNSYWDNGTNDSQYGAYSTNGYVVTDTIIRAEVSVYTVPEGKLLWVGSSATTNPSNAKTFAMQVAQAAADELRKQGLLQ